MIAKFFLRQYLHITCFFRACCLHNDCEWEACFVRVYQLGQVYAALELPIVSTRFGIKSSPFGSSQMKYDSGRAEFHAHVAESLLDFVSQIKKGCMRRQSLLDHPSKMYFEASILLIEITSS